MGEVAELLHAELLEQASRLAGDEAHRASQADLQRAVSSSYYALFHLLVTESTGAVVGMHESSGSLRCLIGRAYGHSEMVRVSKAFSEGERGLPATFRALAGAASVSDDLTFAADTLVTLQAERQRADYDLGARFTREQVLSIVSRAQLAVQAWERAKEEPAARLFLIALLVWNRLPKE